MPSRSRPRAPASRRALQPRALEGEILMDEKTARRVRRTRLRRFLTACAVVALITGSIAVYVSPVLRVQRVEVTGTAGVSAEEVKSLARLDGQSMMRLDLAAAERRVESIPMVQSARLAREWPHTIRIEVTERAPWAFWAIGENRYVIDSEGVVLPGNASIENAPVISDASGPARLSPGDHVDRDAVMLSHLLLQQVPQMLAMNVASLEYSPQKGLTLATDAGYRVVIGDSQNVEYKLAVWRAIEEKLGREAMAGHVLDLRFGDRPSFQ